MKNNYKLSDFKDKDVVLIKLANSVSLLVALHKIEDSEDFELEYCAGTNWEGLINKLSEYFTFKLTESIEVISKDQNHKDLESTYKGTVYEELGESYSKTLTEIELLGKDDFRIKEIAKVLAECKLMLNRYLIDTGRIKNIS